MRATLALWVGVVLAFAGLGYLYSNQLTANRDLSAANAALNDSVDRLTEASKRAQERSKRDAKALVAREAEIASQARKLAEAQQGLQKALGAEQEWSNTNVPTTVQNTLRAASDGLHDRATSPVSDGLRSDQD